IRLLRRTSLRMSMGTMIQRGNTRMLRRIIVPIILAITATFGAFVPEQAQGEVFYAQDEALAMAFPAEAEITRKSFVLSTSHQSSIRTFTKVAMDSALFTFYEGRREG